MKIKEPLAQQTGVHAIYVFGVWVWASAPHGSLVLKGISLLALRTVGSGANDPQLFGLVPSSKQYHITETEQGCSRGRYRELVQELRCMQWLQFYPWKHTISSVLPSVAMRAPTLPRLPEISSLRPFHENFYLVGGELTDKTPRSPKLCLKSSPQF